MIYYEEDCFELGLEPMYTLDEEFDNLFNEGFNFRESAKKVWEWIKKKFRDMLNFILKQTTKFKHVSDIATGKKIEVYDFQEIFSFITTSVSVVLNTFSPSFVHDRDDVEQIAQEIDELIDKYNKLSKTMETIAIDRFTSKNFINNVNDISKIASEQISKTEELIESFSNGSPKLIDSFPREIEKCITYLHKTASLVIQATNLASINLSKLNTNYKMPRGEDVEKYSFES
jgi:methyl-accepting chemotaxis protein